MKIMSFNIKHSIIEDMLGLWRKRYKRVFNFIISEKPDILGLQELTTKGRKYLRKRLNEYNVVGDKRHSAIFTNEYNCIFIKKEYEIISHKTYSLSSNITKLGTKSKCDKFPRICVVAHIKIGKTKFMIVNTHIDNSDTKNKKRLLDIYSKIIDDNLIKDEYIILLGDYNMTVKNDNLVRFSKKYIDPFKDYKQGTFPSRPEMPALDHIFLDKRMTYSNDRIHNNSNDRGYMSDHYPISCEVIIKNNK